MADTPSANDTGAETLRERVAKEIAASLANGQTYEQSASRVLREVADFLAAEVEALPPDRTGWDRSAQYFIERLRQEATRHG